MAETKAVPVRYFKPEGVPGRYFECPHYGTMSVSACARNFTDAPTTAKLGRLMRCVECPLGGRHAAKAAKTGCARSQTPARTRTRSARSARDAGSGAHPAHAQSGPNACVRCRRDGRTAGMRLVGTLRLVRHHTVCVSCYNREREVRVGANAKGAQPKKWSSLFIVRAAYLAGRREVITELSHPVLDRIELALTLMREGHHDGIAWARPQPLRASLDLPTEAPPADVRVRRHACGAR